MKIESGTFMPASDTLPSYQIRVSGVLQGNFPELLDKELDGISGSEYQKIYLDLQETTKPDLSSVNELINAHTRLQKVNKELILVYRKGSAIEEWVSTTGLQKYMQTAITE